MYALNAIMYALLLMHPTNFGKLYFHLYSVPSILKFLFRVLLWPIGSKKFVFFPKYLVVLQLSSVTDFWFNSIVFWEQNLHDFLINLSLFICLSRICSVLVNVLCEVEKTVYRYTLEILQVWFQTTAIRWISR